MGAVYMGDTGGGVICLPPNMCFILSQNPVLAEEELPVVLWQPVNPVAKAAISGKAI